MAITNLTMQNFEEEVNSSNVPVLVDFWATWCGPCKMMLPVIDELEQEIGEEVKICKVNIDEQPELAEKFGVMSIPTFVVLKNGSEVNRAVGTMSKENLRKLI